MRTALFIKRYSESEFQGLSITTSVDPINSISSKIRKKNHTMFILSDKLKKQFENEPKPGYIFHKEFGISCR